ncbi:MAG TPA: SAM-dependent methyltransferase, partial [Roseateles sp.]|nr:SAM-dependent methyltransferase [Roseateles sp.]
LAHQHGVNVRPLVGPSSLLLAVMASGLNGQSFAFNGYLPTDAAQRTKRIQQLEQRSRSDKQTQLLIETPYRNEAMRQALLGALRPGTRLSISVGLTLPGGWTRTATVADWKRQPGDALPDRIPAVFSLLA